MVFCSASAWQWLKNQNRDCYAAEFVCKMNLQKKEDKHFHFSIEKEYSLILNAYKKITGYNTLLERNKIIDNSIRFRNPFTDILNIAQAELLNRYKHSDKSDIQLDNAIFVSINHIAAAMQTTG